MIKTLKSDKAAQEELKKIIEIYIENGWWKDEPPSLMRSIIKGSFIFAVIYHKKEIAGCGRIISDGISDGYIQDLAVLKKFQNKGLGKKLLRFLCLKAKKLSFLGLIAQNNSEKFYLKHGFRRAANSKAMLYDKLQKTEKYGL